MIITVLGLGAIGGFYGASLAKVGHTLRAVVRKGAEEIRQHGLVVKSDKGWCWQVPCDAQSDPLVWQASTKPDVVLIATKTTANPELLSILPSIIGPETQVVVLQNGLLVERDFESVVPAVNLHAGLCFICSHLIEPGNIRHLDYGQIMLAPWGDGEAACRELQDMFEATEDYSVQRVADAHEARWKKLVWNIPYNGLCVAMECETREVMNRARSRVLTIMQEVVAIAQSDGVQIPEWFVEKMISNTEKMSSYAPSMLLDARAGRPLEVEAIYDRAISVAEKNGIHIPEIKKLRGALNKEDA